MWWGCWLSVLGCLGLLFDCGYCDFVACAVNSVDCFDSLSCVLTCCFVCADVTICVIVLGFGLRQNGCVCVGAVVRCLALVLVVCFYCGIFCCADAFGAAF